MFKLQLLLADHEVFHSNFQIDNFIIVKSGQTTYGQYKQTLRELYKRYKGLKEIYIDKQLLQVDIDEFWHIQSKTEIERKRNEIKLAKCEMRMEDMDITIIHTEREFRRFYTIACVLKEKIGMLTDSVRNKLDQEMWIHKLKSLAAMDFIAVGRLRETTVDFIFSLPISIRAPLLTKLNNKEEMIYWFETYDNPLPKYTLIENINIKQLLG